MIGREFSRTPLSAHALTLFYKWIAACFGPMLLAGAIVDFRRGDPILCGIEIVIAVAFTRSWWVDWRPLKHVVATGDGLAVSNYRRKVVIPYRQIEAVTQYGYYYRCIAITLKEPSAFGTDIVFMPYMSFAGLFKRSAPALEILSSACDSAN